MHTCKSADTRGGLLWLDVLYCLRSENNRRQARCQRLPLSPKPSRQAKLHIGGYFDPDDETIVAFQKLKVDLRKSQQEMLLDALRDFVDKQQVARAFR